VLPFVRQEKRAGIDSAPSLSGDQIELAESLRVRAADLLSDIDRLACADSDARFRTTAMPVHLRIAEINRMLFRLSDGTSEDEPMPVWGAPPCGFIAGERRSTGCFSACRREPPRTSRWSSPS